MKKLLPTVLAASCALSACGEAEAPATDEAMAEQPAAVEEFDQQLSEDEANAALDALDDEEAAQE